MRDINRIILAEDDKGISMPLKTILELNGYEVIITDKVKDLMPLALSTNAKWMILDIELTDGTSDTAIPNLKHEFDDLYICVLTGYYERFKELEILNSGANFMLRKPYTPEAVLAQLQKIRNDIEGNKVNTSVYLKKGETFIDLQTGQLITPELIVSLPSNAKKLLYYLSKTRMKNSWKEIPTYELAKFIYEVSEGSDMEIHQQNLRVLVHRTKKIIGDDEFIKMNRKSSNACSYYLHHQVDTVNEIS